jgi:hypothetical protein
VKPRYYWSEHFYCWMLRKPIKWLDWPMKLYPQRGWRDYAA